MFHNLSIGFLLVYNKLVNKMHGGFVGFLMNIKPSDLVLIYRSHTKL